MPNRDFAASLPRVRWTAQAEPIHLPLAQLIYQLRRHDADEGLLLDALNLADMEASVEQWLALDALTSPYAQLERKMQILQRTLARVSPTLKPVALQLTPPFRRHGSAQVTAIFELSDGQTITIYFHNPDTTPHKLNPDDELVSWKWLLNKKDITIVVAPEKGQDLNLLEVATRVLKLAEKNSPAFIRANAQRAEKAKEINQLEREIVELEKELASAQSELELLEHQRNEAQQQAEKRKQNNENNPDTLNDVAIPAGLTETEMTVLVASIYTKPYMRSAEAREMLSPEEMERYPAIQQKLTQLGYLNKSGSTSKKGIKLLETFANQINEEGVLGPWIDAQKQKKQAALKLKWEEETPEPLPEKLTEIADILDKVYDYGTNEDGDENNEWIIRLSPPPPFEEDNDKWILKANTDVTTAYLILNQARFTLDDLDALPAAQLAESIHHIIIRFQGKASGYIQAIQYLEQGATQARLHLHYGDFNHTISGGLFDTVNGHDLIIGITAQLHADGKVWARARISENGELDILSGSAGDSVIGRAESAEEVARLLRRLMDTHSSSGEKERTNIEEFIAPDAAQKLPFRLIDTRIHFDILDELEVMGWMVEKNNASLDIGGAEKSDLNPRGQRILTASFLPWDWSINDKTPEYIRLSLGWDDLLVIELDITQTAHNIAAKINTFAHNIPREDTNEFLGSIKPYEKYLIEAKNDRFEASKNFYKSELQGKIVKTVIGDVWMLGSGWQKMKVGMKSDQLKATLLPYIPDILKYGKYEGREDSHKERKDDYIAFHFFTKEISFEQKEFTVAVSVSESSNKQFEYRAYGLKHSEDAAWKKKMAPSSGGEKPPLDAISYRTTDIIDGTGKIQPPILDKVNPELEMEWNIRILKVVDLATGKRIYALEDEQEVGSSIQQTVSNQAKTIPVNPVVAQDASDTAALYIFDEKRTLAQRKRANNAALALLETIDSGEKDGQNLSIADKAILARYSGTGGALIGADGKKGSAYEYYTPAPIAAGMWDLLQNLGFSGGKVLDPCAGTGIFSALAPDNAVIDAVELNETSGKVNQYINNQTGRSTTIAPFEQVASATPDETYDAVITNVPFGGVADRGGNQLLDNKYQKEPLQNYFILRSLEKLRPGGLALFIVPPRCVSGKGGKEESLRVKISYLAEFLGAYRLPNKVFGSASADTMTDIIALRKYSREVLEKIDELRQQAPETLIEANVQWPVFTQGHYFEDEGKRFVLGEFVAKDPAKFRDIDRVITDKPVTEIAQMLAKFPDSRINWKRLESTETLPIIYREGESVYQAGQNLVLENGQWVAPVNQNQDSQTKLLSALLSNPYKTFAAQLGYEQVHTWFDYMIQAGPLNVPAWLRSLISGLKKLETPAQRECYWHAGIIALAVQQVLDERLSDDEPFDFLGEYLDLSAALKKHAHTYNKCPPTLRGVLNDAFAVARTHYRNKTGYSVIWRGEGKEKLHAQAVDAQSGFDGLRYQAQSVWVDRQQAAQVLGSEFDPMNNDEWCISADGKIVARADDVYVGNVSDYLLEIDQHIHACRNETIKAKLLRQKLHAQTRIHKVKADNLHFSLQSPHVSLEQKCEFLRRFVHPSAVIVIDNESGKPTIDFVIKASKLRDKDKLIRRLGHWIKKGSITLGGVKLDQDERDGLNQLQAMCNRANEQFNTWVKGNRRIIDQIQSNLDNPNKQRFTQIDDESSLSISGMNPALHLHGYQNAFVRRMGRDFSGINGFGVGLGKTFTALAAVQYAQSIGVKSKTLFVVPGSVLSNWQKEAARAYTHTDDCLFVGLSINKNGKGVVKSSQYDADLNKILENRHRKIFMTMEAFERIRLREETINSYEKYLRTHDSSFAESEDKKKDEQKKSAAKTLLALLTDKKGSAPYLEDMGIDSLVMDEAHAYKNSASTLDVDKARYLSLASAAQRGIDAQAKAWVVRRKSGQRNDGVLLLTATPITNSPLEIYSMLSLAGGIERLNNQFAGIKGADDFMKTVCVIENGPDVTSDGIKYIANIFTGLANVPLLHHALTATAIIKEAHEVGAQVILPEGEEKPTSIVLPDSVFARLKQYKGAFRYAVDDLSNKRPNRGDKAAFEQLQQETGESIALIGCPFNLINKMSRYIVDPELEARASFWQYDQAQQQHAHAVIEQFNKLKKVEKHSRKGRYTQDKAIIGKITIKDGDHLKEKLKIQVYAQLLETEQRIVLDSIDPAIQNILESLAEKAGLNLEVSVSPKLAALLDNVQLEQATPRGATADGEKLPYTKQIIFCDILPLHHKIKRLLIQRAGIESQHIAIITGKTNNSPDEVLAVAEGFNAYGEENKYRFIIANKKAEVGINLQQGTQAIHHLTIGWTPDSLTQRNGRAVRQGNRTARVSVYYYDAEGTFDVSKRNMVNKKADWIGQLISGKEENNLAISGGLTPQQQEALIEIVGDASTMAQIENSIAAQEKRERIERNRTTQLTQLDTIAKQRKFLDDNEDTLRFIHQRALQAWDIWQEINRLQSRLETFKGKESLALRLNNALEQEREKLNRIVDEVDSSLIIYKNDGNYPDVIKGKRWAGLIAAMQQAVDSYGRNKKENFESIIKHSRYGYISEIVTGSLLENEWQSEIDMARNLLESAQKEFMRQAQFYGALPENLAEKIARDQGIIYNNQPIVAGTFVRQDEALAVFDGLWDYGSNAGQPRYYARHSDTSGALINLNKLEFIYPGQSGWEACVNQAAELEDKINQTRIQQGREANFNEFSKIIPEVAQRSHLARTARYSIEEHTLPSPYFPYVITSIMIKESRLLREIYDTQASLLIGRDLNYFTVPVETDIGTSQDENARFNALIQYALAKEKILDQNTLNHYDRHWGHHGLKNALHVAVPQSSYFDEFQVYISAIKEKDSSAEELSQAAQQWLREKTEIWLDWQSLNAENVLPKWMSEVIEDKPMTAPNHHADDDLVWVSGKNDPNRTKEWRALIKRYAHLHGSIAKWNGRKLAWNIRFKAWQALLNAYPNAANELHLIS